MDQLTASLSFLALGGLLNIGCGSGDNALTGSGGPSASPSAVSSAAGGSAASASSTDPGTTGGGSGSSETAGAGTPSSEKFSFFLTSLKAMRELSGSNDGFGGDLRFGETGDGAGLRGADKICTAVAEQSMPGNAKTWRAFLSATQGEDGMQVDAVDRIGSGPWYDRAGRLFAQNSSDVATERPTGAAAEIVNDFPNENGVPNHDPDGTGAVDNHDVLTGTNDQGRLFSTDAGSTCSDWTSAASSGAPRVGHSWPRAGGGPGGGGGGGPGGAQGGGSMNNWMSALNEAGCAPGAFVIEKGPPGANGTKSVGDGGGYGGIYCFALTP